MILVSDTELIILLNSPVTSFAALVPSSFDKFLSKNQNVYGKDPNHVRSGIRIRDHLMLRNVRNYINHLLGKNVDSQASLQIHRSRDEMQKKSIYIAVHNDEDTHWTVQHKCWKQKTIVNRIIYDVENDWLWHNESCSEKDKSLKYNERFDACVWELRQINVLGRFSFVFQVPTWMNKECGKRDLDEPIIFGG